MTDLSGAVPNLVCARCDKSLEMRKVEASYLGQTFPVELPASTTPEEVEQ